MIEAFAVIAHALDQATDVGKRRPAIAT